MSKVNLNNLSDILDARGISECLGVSYNTALRLVKYKIKHIKIGNQYRVTKKSFFEFLNLN